MRLQQFVRMVDNLSLLESLAELGQGQAGKVLDSFWNEMPEVMQALYLLKARRFDLVADWEHLPLRERTALAEGAEELRDMCRQGRRGAGLACHLLEVCGVFELLQEHSNN